MPSDTRAKADLELLAAVERGEVVSQLSLSKRIGIAVGLINALLKRAVRKGHVKVSNAPAKRYAYYLTPKGFAEKSRLVAEYLDVSLGFFRRARGEYRDLFERARLRGWTKLALAGSGELAEIAAIAAAETEIELVGLIDAATNRERILGLRVAHTAGELGALDAVVVTDSRTPQAVFDLLAQDIAPERVLAPGLLRIVQARDLATSAD